MLVGRVKTAVETGQRTGCKWTLAVPGRFNESLDWDYQTANVIENLKRLADPVRALGPRHRPRAPQSQGPPRALPDQDGPGLPDLQGRREPVGQDPRRHVPPADHRGQHHPQHRRLLGRAGLLPRRRLAGPEGTGHGRDELPQYLQAHPRQGLPGRSLPGARQEPNTVSRARRRSSRPTAPPTIFRGKGVGSTFYTP